MNTVYMNCAFSDPPPPLGTQPTAAAKCQKSEMLSEEPPLPSGVSSSSSSSPLLSVAPQSPDESKCPQVRSTEGKSHRAVLPLLDASPLSSLLLFAPRYSSVLLLDADSFSCSLIAGSSLPAPRVLAVRKARRFGSELDAPQLSRPAPLLISSSPPWRC